MKKRTLFVAAFLVLAAACGKEGGQGLDLTSEAPSPSPSAMTHENAPGASTAPSASTSASAKPGASAAAVPGAAQPVKPPPGASNRPKDGKYVYTFKGESTNPFAPGGAPQPFNGQLTKQVSHKGDVYTEEQTNTESPGRTTQRTRWEKARILLLYIKTETPAGDFSCTFNPPLVIAHFPIHPEKFPTQTFKGQGNACNGKLDITVERKENTTDGNGKTWSTWRFKIHTTVNSSQLSTTSDETQWISPDLGVEIRTDGRSQGEVKQGATSQKFSSHAATALKTHP